MDALQRDVMRKLMQPESVAIIGASNDPEKFSGRSIAYMARLGYKGRVYPVNPGVEAIQGYRCYGDIRDVPGPVDVAIVARPARDVIPEIEKSLAVGIRAFVVFGGGFAEAGPEGRTLQLRLAEVCRAAGAVLCGPNGTGLLHVASRAALSFMSNLDREIVDGGSLALVSNSGSITAMLFQGRGRIFNSVVSTGNEAVLSGAHYIEYALEDPGTRGVVAFLESIRDPERLLAAARRATELGKPIAVLKAGRSERSADVAASHTGAMIDDDTVVDAVFREHAVIRVKTIEELKAVAVLMHAGREGIGPRVGIVTPSGGTAVLITDEIVERGLALPDLAPATKEALRRIIPNATPGNPMDVTGFGADPGTIGKVGRVVIDDPGIDVVMVPLGGAVGTIAAGRAEALIGIGEATEKTIVPIWQSTTRDQPGYDRLHAAGLPVFTDYSMACLALAHLVSCREGQARARARGAAAAAPSAALQAAVTAALASGHPNLTEPEAKAILAAGGIAIPAAAAFTAGSAAGPAADSAAFPAVLKIVSRDIVHKSAAGGLAFLRTRDELEPAVQRMGRAVAASSPQARVDGFLLEEIVIGGVELLVGVKRDHRFGPTLTLAMGGVLANAFAGAVTALLPPDRDAARVVVRRFAAGLDGTPAGEALAEFIDRIATVARACGDRLEILEVNPVKLTGAQGAAGAVALDAVLGFVAHA